MSETDRPSSASLMIGIALQRSAIERATDPYHWTLVVDPTPSSSYDGACVRTYEMIEQEADGRIVSRSTTFTKPQDESGRALPPFIGVVHLGTIDSIGEDQLDEFLREFGAEREGYKTDPVRGWTSSGWVLRCLNSLAEGDYLVLNMSDDEIHGKVLALGKVLEKLREGDDDATVPLPKLNL